jgi:hypothetical protein
MTVAPRGPLMLAVGEPGTPEQGYWPSVGEDRAPVLDAGETVQQTWNGLVHFWAAGATGSLHKVWESPKRAAVWMTDRRIVYVLEKYDIGTSRYFDLGSVTGGAMTLGSRTIAKMKRHGKVAAGQVRFEWPASVLRFDRQNILGKVLDRYLGFDCASSDGVLRTLIHFGKSDGDLEDTAIRAVANYRLQRNGLDADTRQHLDRIADSPTAAKTEPDQKHGTRHWIPGGINVPNT